MSSACIYIYIYMYNSAGCRLIYHIYPKYSQRQVWANSVDPDQMPQNVASDLGLHCLLLIQHYLDQTGKGNKMDMFKFYDRDGKELWCPNI